MIAHQVDGLRLFISQYFTPESRILLRRNIVERAQTLAPFLTFDRDPYIVADGDHYSYILDAYTTSDSYPYSQAYQGAIRAFDGQNYLRNSVKAVIDAYNGSVTFYVFDRLSLAPTGVCCPTSSKMQIRCRRRSEATSGTLKTSLRFRPRCMAPIT